MPKPSSIFTGAGSLPTLLDDPAPVRRAALAIGREWLGLNHPAVLCLPIGISNRFHGRLPGPFLREVEALLGAGVLRVAIASPTLAQGLNLNAAVLLIPTLYRAVSRCRARSLPTWLGARGVLLLILKAWSLRHISTGELALYSLAKSRSLVEGAFTYQWHHCRGRRGHGAAGSNRRIRSRRCHGISSQFAGGMVPTRPARR